MHLPDTLKNRTARSAIFIIRESLRSLRQYTADLSDPANIDRIIRTSGVLSTSLKKLEPFLDAPVGTKQSTAPAEGELINVPTVIRVLAAVQDGRICGECGGIIEGCSDHDHGTDAGAVVSAPERAKARRATESE